MSTQQQDLGRAIINMGKLRSEIQLTLHSYHAVRLWQGRKPRTDEKHQGVLGLTGYISMCGTISNAAANDDPYADWMLIQIEERVEQAKKRLGTLKEEIQSIIDSIPSQLSISENLNVSPARLPVFVSTQAGYQGVYLIIQFDELARKLLLATHVGLLGRKDKEVLMDQAAHQLRSVFALTQNYRNTGVTRDDIAANNARAREAIEKYGLPPDEVLKGTIRSSYAPAIVRKTGLAAGEVMGEEDDEVFESETEMKADIQKIAAITEEPAVATKPKRTRKTKSDDAANTTVTSN